VKASHQLVNQSSGTVEYYTDPRITWAAREVMGSIDLDPASTPIANAFGVFAQRIFTKEDNGLTPRWKGNIWLNHPFHRGEKACPQDRDKCKKNVCKTRGHIDQDIPSNATWINKAVSEYQKGNATSLILICFASTSEAWFRPLLDVPLCFLTPRTGYYRPDGTLADDVTKGSVVAYMGPDTDRFKRTFETNYNLGVVKI
jgi:hypothetical protein